ncbi:hypothetical protein NDU88_004422 [Pleurodeles waltl]|uniref:DDE Tnp4 domain-containing protein n=1 Tax=Pleurodeles waltl TaxID=8319 RepID=A0AAV7VG65_PLEWA|nr:hypothetical protein NDU88_004422 [Pleurodeles waltl]
MQAAQTPGTDHQPRTTDHWGWHPCLRWCTGSGCRGAAGGAGGGDSGIGAGGGVSGIGASRGLVAGSVASVLAAGSVASVLVVFFVAAVLVPVFVAAVLVAGSVTAVLGSVTAVLVAVQVVVQVAVLVAVLSAVQDVGNFLNFGGGGMSLPSLHGTLAALLLGTLQKPAVAGTTVPGDVVAEVLGWDLERRALGDRQGGGDSGYPNLSWLLTPVRNLRTRAEDHYNEAHGRTRRVIERTFGLLKARFRCLQMTGGSLYYSPKKVCQIIVACCMLHNLALRRQVPFLQEDGPEGGLVAAVEPVDSEEQEAEEEDIDNRNNVIQQYFQ